MNLYVITMEDGSRWGISAEIIAKNRAEYYSSTDPDTTYEEEFEAMMKWFFEDDYEFADWAKNNMRWDDVKDSAIQLSSEEMPIDWQENWVNGEYEYVTIEDKKIFDFGFKPKFSCDDSGVIT